jgi:phosphoglycolate phosphatase
LTKFNTPFTSLRISEIDPMKIPILQNIAAVIFDCDGVMFDSRQANANFYNHLLARFGLSPLGEEQLAFVHMHTAEKSVEYLFKGTPYLEAAQIYRMEMEYTPFIRDMAIEPDLKPLLQALKPRMGLAVATNRSNTMREVLELHALQLYFDIVVTSLDVERAKPHPDPLFKILSFFEISPRQAIYIGDSSVDAETAASAGVPFASYKNREIRADFHLTHLLEILELLESAGGRDRL